MSSVETFDYARAFSRNHGLISAAEQQRLKHCRIGLAGLGGVGGAHLQALARLGVGAFHLADPDTFGVVNINRQLGATTATIGRVKADVLREMALSINPEAQVETFCDGINPSNLDAFLSGVDVVVDGIEFFCIETRRMLFDACRQRRIPIVTAGPIGYGAAVMVFTPDTPSFDAYFNLDATLTRAEQIMAFALGLAPGMVSDVDPATVDIDGQKGPALSTACLLCAAAAATEVLKLLCNRGRVSGASRGVYYDLYRGRTVGLRARPHLRSLRGRVLRWFFFRKYPALRAMHDRELSSRQTQSVRLQPSPATHS